MATRPVSSAPGLDVTPAHGHDGGAVVPAAERAAAITRRIPYWGLHIPGNRAGTHLVEVDLDVAPEMLDWGLLGDR